MVNMQLFFFFSLNKNTHVMFTSSLVITAIGSKVRYIFMYAIYSTRLYECKLQRALESLDCLFLSASVKRFIGSLLGL